MERAHLACYTDFTEDCSLAVHRDLKIDWQKTNKCVNDSFVASEDDNTLLEEDAIEWVLRGPHFVPAVVINNITYRGTLDPENVFNAICQGFKDPQAECSVTTNVDTISKNKVNLTFFFIAIIAIIVLNIVILILCRACSRRDMDNHVKLAISEYMSLR